MPIARHAVAAIPDFDPDRYRIFRFLNYQIEYSEIDMKTWNQVADELNQAAKTTWENSADADETRVDVCRNAATKAGFQRMRSNGQTELWIDGNGIELNLWVDAPSDEIGPGGIGFDDNHQIEYPEV